MVAARPEMIPVSSSNIRAIGYDAAAKELHVEFARGGYVYLGVEPEQHAALMAADSIGRHLNARIKDRFKHRTRDEGG